jgi:hypothetical protein
MKIGIGKVGVIARPAFRVGKNNSTQNFAALHLRGLLFLLRGLRMKRALGSHRIRLCRQRSKRAMI